jgi:hypothetical protein
MRARAQPLHQDPGHAGRLPAIEEAIFAGVPVNVTLLFSREQYVAAAEAYLRGIERRIAAGLNPAVGSVASVFVSRWDVAVAGQGPAGAEQPLGVAIARRAPTRRTATCWLRPAGSGPQRRRAPQRCCGPARAPRIPGLRHPLCIKALAAPFTVNTMPEGTLKAFADHGEVGADNGGRRRRLRGGAGSLRQGRRRRGRPGRPAAGRGGQSLRQILERADGRASKSKSGSDTAGAA